MASIYISLPAPMSLWAQVGLAPVLSVLKPLYAAYIINLAKASNSPFEPLSDEEASEESNTEQASDEGSAEQDVSVVIDMDNIERRTLALPLPERNYRMTASGPAGSVFYRRAIG